VPDEIWNDIKLEGKPEGSGLLCISCADRLARNKGYGLYWSAAEKDFPEPKADNGYSGTGFANLKETTELQAGELQEENQRLRKEMARVRGVIRNTSWDDIDNLRKDIRRKDEELVSLRKKYDDLKSRKVTAREHAEVLQREIKQKDEELEEVRMEVEKLEHSETNLNVLDTLRMELVHARNQSDIMTTVADQLRDSQGCSFESIEKAAKAVGYGPGAVAHILNVLKATPPVVGDKHRQEGEPLIVNTEQTEQLEKLKKDNKDLYNSVDYHLRLKDEHNEILKRLKAKLKALQHQHALVIGDIDGKKHHIGYIENANADLIAEVNKLKNARDNAIMEARGWAIGAKTQRAIVRKVGQIVGLQDWEDIAGAVQKLSDAAMDTPQRRSARKH
jgi:chromosome segregation ATPase